MSTGFAFYQKLISVTFNYLKENISTGSHEYTPSSFSGRFLFITLFLLSSLVFNFYTSILVSTLIESLPKNNIKTIENLADSKLNVGFDDIINTRVYLNVCYLFKKIKLTTPNILFIIYNFNFIYTVYKNTRSSIFFEQKISIDG